MAKKKTARKLRRHPELLNDMLSQAGPSQINRQYKAAEEDLSELLAWEREHPAEGKEKEHDRTAGESPHD